MASDPKSFDVDMEKRIFIKGFPKETTVSDLTSFFETYGIVKNANIVKDHKSGLAKYAFVTFESKEVGESLCTEKSIKFQEKKLCIGKAKRSKGASEKNAGSAHEFRRYFPTRQPPLDYSSSTAPMAYYVYPFYNQNAVYVPAMQASTMAPISASPPSYQSSAAAYIPTSNPHHQMFTTIMPSNPAAGSFVQGMPGSHEQFLLPMPRTNYVDGYTDYQTIPSIITVPFSPSNDWTSLSSTSSDTAISVFQKEALPPSPSVPKAKKSFTYVVKEDEGSETSESSSQVSGPAPVVTTTKEIVNQ